MNDSRSNSDNKAKRHRFITNLSLIQLCIISISIPILSILSSSKSNISFSSRTHITSTGTKPSYKNRNRRLKKKKESRFDDDVEATTLIEKVDFSKYSCNDIFAYMDTLDMNVSVKNEIQCNYAKTCNYNEGIFLAKFFCSENGDRTTTTNLQKKAWYYVPILLLILLILFRVVASTAEDYFSPSLEMFSIQLGLPPRFAGVTLLALGNGAPDIAATVSAMLQDRSKGYLMSIGELIGAAMFSSTIILFVILYLSKEDSIVSECNYTYPCRGALLREILVFVLTMSLVWYQFEIVGRVDYSFIYLCLFFYALYVAIVLAADVFHKTVYLPKVLLLERHQSGVESGCEEMNLVESTSLLPNQPKSLRRGSCSSVTSKTVTEVAENFVEAISNYSDPTSSWTMSTSSPPTPIPNAISTTDQKTYQNGTTVLPDGSAANTPTATSDHSKESLIVVHLHHGGVQSLDYVSLQRHDSSNSVVPHHTPSFTPSPTLSIFQIVKQDVYRVLYEIKQDVYENEENHLIDVILLTIEIPITILRMLTVPLPCPGYYNRSIVGLSTILSSFWLQFYCKDQFDINYFLLLPYYSSIIFPSCLGMYVWIKGKDIQCLNLWVTVFVAMYGFAIAATWLDYMADFLVNVLSFLGILYHIPGSIMGLTVLAWGNAFADLSANMTLAKKGLSEMAMTACFAGPVFNILIGIGMGFFFLLEADQKDHKKVQLTGSLEVGLIAAIVNCVLIMGCSVLFQGRIPIRYGYVGLFIFVAYTIGALVAMRFTNYSSL